MIEQYKKDLEKVKAAREVEIDVYKKYRESRLESAAMRLEAAIAIGTDIKDLRFRSYRIVSIGYIGGYFGMCAAKDGFNLTNKVTKYKFTSGEWYIKFDCGGCGRLNLIRNERLAYTEECTKVWEAFCDKIQSYNPVDWDELNKEWVFTVEDGMRLYSHIEEIIADAKKAMENAVKKYKIEQLKAELNSLEQEDELEEENATDRC